jgi:hypothetical protein
MKEMETCFGCGEHEQDVRRAGEFGLIRQSWKAWNTLIRNWNNAQRGGDDGPQKSRRIRVNQAVMESMEYTHQELNEAQRGGMTVLRRAGEFDLITGSWKAWNTVITFRGALHND